MSVVIRSRNEADRLRLTLTSLAGQTLRSDIVIVDDGSTPQGRTAAPNAGARAASGETVLFPHGGRLAGPTLVERHAALHRDRAGVLGRRETWHLRCTRFLLDPETARPQAAHAGAATLLPVFWAGISDKGDAPIKTLSDLAAMAARASGQGDPGALAHG